MKIKTLLELFDDRPSRVRYFTLASLHVPREMRSEYQGQNIINATKGKGMTVTITTIKIPQDTEVENGVYQAPSGVDVIAIHPDSQLSENAVVKYFNNIVPKAKLKAGDAEALQEHYKTYVERNIANGIWKKISSF